MNYCSMPATRAQAGPDQGHRDRRYPPTAGQRRVHAFRGTYAIINMRGVWILFSPLLDSLTMLLRQWESASAVQCFAAAAASCRRLRRIDLASCNLSDESFSILSNDHDAGLWPAVDSLNIQHNPALTSTGFEHLVRSFGRRGADQPCSFEVSNSEAVHIGRSHSCSGCAYGHR